MRMHARGRLAAMMMMGLTACADGPTRFEVENRSPSDVTGVVLSGRDFRTALGDLPRGGRRVVQVDTRGQCGLRVTFAAGGKTRLVGPLGYFLAGATVDVTFGPNGRISVQEQ